MATRLLSTSEYDRGYRKLPRGGIVANHQPSLNRTATGIWKWLVNLPDPLDFADPYAGYSGHKSLTGCNEAVRKVDASVWETAAKHRAILAVKDREAEVSRSSKKRKNHLVIDLMGDEEDIVAGGGLHIKKRVRLNARGTQLCTTVKGNGRYERKRGGIIGRRHSKYGTS